MNDYTISKKEAIPKQRKETVQELIKAKRNKKVIERKKEKEKKERKKERKKPGEEQKLTSSDLIW